MHPHLIDIAVWKLIAVVGGALTATLVGKNLLRIILAALAGALVGGVLAYQFPFGHQFLPVQSYGVLMLMGFLVGVWFAARRMPLIGVAPQHCLDMGIAGVIVGLFGARLFHVLMNWPDFNPFYAGGFDFDRVKKMFALWEGGLVFYGAFVTAIPYCYYYGRKHKLPALAFTDIMGPGMLLGQAFGRIGCFMTGCCFGKVCDLPWGVRFPVGAPAYEEQFNLNLLEPAALHSLKVHPTQLYSSLAAFLTWLFIYTFWPRRQYDGQCLALAFIMAGTTRFFEETLRMDDIPAFPTISTSMTIAQWAAIPIVFAGFVMLFAFRRRNKLTMPVMAV